MKRILALMSCLILMLLVMGCNKKEIPQKTLPGLLGECEVSGRITDEYGNTLNGIRVVITGEVNKDRSPYSKKNIDTVYTSNNGEYIATGLSAMITHCTVRADDVDGEDNGGNYWTAYKYFEVTYTVIDFRRFYKAENVDFVLEIKKW